MPGRKIRVALLVLDVFVALSAIGGGLAVVAALDRFPPEWLHGSPFSDYSIPGLILAGVVGGSAAAAAVVLWRRPRLGVPASALAGAILAGWVVGEIVILNQNGAATSPRSPTEGLYLVVGTVMVMSGIVALIVRTRTTPA
jgi:hypothetical protein